MAAGVGRISRLPSENNLMFTPNKKKKQNVVFGINQMVKYRLTRYTETFEQFYGHTTELSKRINEQRTEVASMLTKLAIWTNKQATSQVEPPAHKPKPDIPRVFCQVKEELDKWNYYLEIYMKKPDHKLDIEPRVG